MVTVLALHQILRLKPGRRYCTLGRLAHEVGWGHRELVNRLEAKRKVRALPGRHAEAYRCDDSSVWLGDRTRRREGRETGVVKRVS